MESNYRDGPTGHKNIYNPVESNHKDGPTGHNNYGGRKGHSGDGSETGSGFGTVTRVSFSATIHRYYIAMAGHIYTDLRAPPIKIRGVVLVLIYI